MSSKVTIQPSGHSFMVNAGETILDAALRQGYALPYGCRNGCCGACKGKVLSGEVDYADDEPMAVSEQEQAEGLALFCIARAPGDLTIEVKEIEAAREIPIRTMEMEIARLERFSDEVMGVWLAPPPNERLQFLAGQYVSVVLPDGRHRSFSLANPPHDDALLELHVRYIRGGRFTEQLFKDLKVGDKLTIEGPHGSFYMREDSKRPMIMLATGTGFGPVKGIIEHAIAEGSQRPIHLYWGARSRDGLYLDGLAREWDRKHAHIHYIPVLSQPKPEDDWTGRTGYVQQVAAADFDSLGDYELYACGHPEMVYSARDELVAKGLDPEHCFGDAFEWAKD